VIVVGPVLDLKLPVARVPVALRAGPGFDGPGRRGIQRSIEIVLRIPPG
jgi:hypothetical protein